MSMGFDDDFEDEQWKDMTETLLKEEIAALRVQLKEAEKVIEHFVDDAPSNWSDHYEPAKKYLEKYK